MTASERMVSLEARGLCGGYGRVPILHGIDLDVGEGEVVGILGHNGMGKTTLLKTLMGFLPATAGSVRHYGTDITRLAANERARLGIGYVPQGRGIFPRLSVRENLHFARSDHGDGDEGAALDALLADFPRLEPLLDRKGEMLSGGEQQLLALARCLMASPELLLLDEPTEGIQPSIIEEMAEILTRLEESRGLSILLVEQNLDFIAELADRVLVLERGRITGELERGELADQAKLDRHLGFGAVRAQFLNPAFEREGPMTPAVRAPVRPPSPPVGFGVARPPASTHASGREGAASATAHPPTGPPSLPDSGRPTAPLPRRGSGAAPAWMRSSNPAPLSPLQFSGAGVSAGDTRSSEAGVPSRVLTEKPDRPSPLPSRSADASRARPRSSGPSQSPSPAASAAGTSPSGTPPPPPRVRTMTIKRPVLTQMRAMAERFGMHLSDAELEEFREIMEPYIQAWDRIDAAPDHLPEVRWPRAPGYRPSPAENPLNAWYYRTEVRGAPDGPLRGRRIALKDTVCLAGVPMMNGSSIMEGYVPEIDATIVTRILEAGGTIAGKAHCENFCLSGGSHTGAAGPVHNPWKRGYMAGGSSSGSAALVAAGEVEMAIGGDQGGSIRIPSSNCGVCGMKPTHGLVPYTGVMPIEQTIDHVGPITGNVADNALLLEVLAGADGLDPRQHAPEVHRYTEALGRGCGGLRIGVLKEGFDRPESEPDVDGKVRDAAERFRALGARVQEVSIEEHRFAADLWTAIAVEGLQDLMMHGNGFGTNHRGLFLPSMIDRVATWRHRADELSHSLKVCMFLGEYFRDSYRGRYYGKAQNLMRGVTRRYLDALREVDLLLMPTLPMKAQPIPPPDCSIALYVQRAFEMIGNTAAFSVSGLPAMSIPCGLGEGLPIGMMLVGPLYGEMAIYRAAHAFEQSADWRTL